MAYSTGGQRNVIVLGKTGCGKSTLANKIICASEENETFKVKESFQAVTTKIVGSIENVVIGTDTYKINMIDTIGFSDNRQRGAMSDNNIVHAIKKHMRARAPEGISLIIFVFRRGRFTEDEQKVFQIMADNFTDYIKEVSCLVITGCDGLNEDARSQLISNFKTDPLTERFATIMTKGIYTVGFPKVSSLSSRAKEAAIEEMKDDIAPIHDMVAKAKIMYLHDEIQIETFWEKFSICTIL